jgi:hypothetical protein
MSEIAIYESDNGQVSVRLVGDTVWLRQDQLAELFGRERSVITKHFGNVFEEGEGELLRESVCAQFAHTAQDGKTTAQRVQSADSAHCTGFEMQQRVGSA